MTVAIPIPPPELLVRHFYPFLEYMMIPLRDRLSGMGVPDPIRSIRQILVLQPSQPPTKPPFYTLRPTKSIENAVEIAFIQSVISQAGWLTWEDFLWLVIVGRDKGPGGSLKLMCLSERELQKEVSFLYQLMKDKEMRPFAPVLRRMVERYLLEEQMRKKYRKAVQKRYRDFQSYGRSLNFGYHDLEEDIANGEVDDTNAVVKES
jgi:hypothetical protein